jgi:hypothetical protein
MFENLLDAREAAAGAVAISRLRVLDVVNAQALHEFVNAGRVGR